MVKVVAVASYKGGVGKSTVSVNLAAAIHGLGIRTVLFDMDSQESAVGWFARRRGNGLRAASVSPGQLCYDIAAWDADLVIIDTPPRDSREAEEAIARADIVLTPCRPSLPDIDAIRHTAQLLDHAGRTGYVVINAAPPTASAMVEDSRGQAVRPGMRLAPVVLRQRGAYRSCWGNGRGVTEFEPGGKAAAEILALTDFVLHRLDIVRPGILPILHEDDRARDHGWTRPH